MKTTLNENHKTQMHNALSDQFENDKLFFL